MKKSSQRSKRSAASISSSGRFQFHDDWIEFLSLLIKNRAKFLLVGGHALAIHGSPRLTEDLDIFIEPTRANAVRVRRALTAFGFGDSAPDVAVLIEPYRVLMLGGKPFRIDILNTISGVSFATAWRNRVRVRASVGSLNVLSRKDLVANKRASARPKDKADLALLGVDVEK